MPKLAKHLIAASTDGKDPVTVQLWTGFPNGRSAVIFTSGQTITSSISMGPRKATTRYTTAVAGLTALTDTSQLPRVTCCGQPLPYAAPWCPECSQPTSKEKQ